MKHFSPEMLETAFVRPGTPSFAELIENIGTCPDLPATRRRDILSGLRSVAKALGRMPGDIPADPAWLQPRLAKVAPAALGLSAKSWQNAVSAARGAMTRFGLVERRNNRIEHLSPAWRALWEGVLASGDKTLQPGLCRFVHFLSRHDIAPEEVGDAHAGAYHEAVALNEISKDPETAWRAAVKAWNLAVRRRPDWPQQTLSLPRRDTRIARPVADFPESFGIDLDAYLARLARPDPLDPDGLTRALKPSTIAQRRSQILRFAGVLVEAGLPIEAVDSVSALVAPATAKRGLEWMLVRNGGESAPGIAEMAQLLQTIARRHARLEAGEQAEIDRFAQRLALPRRKGMTAKNRERLRPLQDPETLRRLLLLPERLMARAGRAGDTHAAALDREVAVAIAILLCCPVRSQNLAAIHLERNIQRPGDGRAFLVFEEREVKNEHHVEFELPDQVVAMLETHLAHRVPRLCPPATPWLFPKRDGSAPVVPTQLGSRISQAIRRETGLVMNAHLFRHLAAMIWLQARPGAYEAARRLLGHSALSTTLNAYAGFEAGTATRLFAEALEAARRA